MPVIQLNVILKEQIDDLLKITKLLLDGGINIRILYVSCSTNNGILRLIVDEPDVAYKVLKEADFLVSKTNVIAVIPSEGKGMVNKIVSLLTEGGIALEYLYTFVTKTTSEAVVVLRVDDIIGATEIYLNNNIRVLSSEEVNRF